MAKKPDKNTAPAGPPTARPTEVAEPGNEQASIEFERFEELLGNLPEDQAREFRAIKAQSFFSGPLPPPAVLKNYDEALPGAAERIFALTEKEQSHRHQWENKALASEISYSRLGLWLGAAALFAVIIGVVVCAFIGQAWAAGTLGALGLTGIVTALIKGRSFSHDDKQE